MSKLTDVKQCHVCYSIKLIPRYNIPIPDILTDEEIRRDVLQCDDCDTLHYIEDGEISYEFSCKIGKPITKIHNRFDE